MAEVGTLKRGDGTRCNHAINELRFTNLHHHDSTVLTLGEGYGKYLYLLQQMQITTQHNHTKRLALLEER